MRVFRPLSAVCCLLLSVCISVSAYTDSPPSNPPFTGSCYLTGDTREFGTVTVYLPVSYRSGYLSFNGDNLFNVTNSSVSGVLYDGGTEYDFRISSWSEPQYRVQDSGYYQYEDLTFTSIDYSNMEIAESFPPLVSYDDVLPYLPIALLGVIVLCLFMKRF